MEHHYIVTPYFIGDNDALEHLIRDNGEWSLNKPALPPGTAQLRMTILYKELSKRIYDTLQERKLPVSIAGDCISSLGVMSALQRASINPFLIWLDAHGDFNTWETTQSGFLGGMPLAMMTGRGEQTIVQGVGLTPVRDEGIYLLNARDLDQLEREALHTSSINYIPDISEFVVPNGPLYVHFDTDVINPVDAPAQRYKANGGPRIEELQKLFAKISETGNVVAISLSAWYPKLDTDGKTEKNSLVLLENLIGL